MILVNISNMPLSPSSMFSHIADNDMEFMEKQLQMVTFQTLS